MEIGQNVTKKRKIQISHSESCEKDEKHCNANWIGGEIIVGACDLILGIEDELVRELNSLTFGLPVAYVWIMDANPGMRLPPAYNNVQNHHNQIRWIMDANPGMRLPPAYNNVQNHHNQIRYNPLIYAWELHKQYVRNYGGRRVEVLLVGMNPGPFGMAQTGVPFGDNIIVRDFLKINGKVDSPSVTHPKRQISGLNCPRREISGQRLWGWAEKQFHSAENFLNRFWIHNYCPLLFMEASSKNRTPDKLPANERESLETCCNKALIATINLLQPRLVVGVGKYATKRIRASGAKDIVVGEVMHPSPANPKANKEWRNIFETQLKSLGIVV